MNNEDTKQTIKASANKFRAQFHTLFMATASEQLDVDASYAPFILDSNSSMYVFISTLARHTQNLLQHPRVSLLWVNNEQSETNNFARERLTLYCSSKIIARADKKWDSLLTLFQMRHGETITLLKQFDDFQLFRFDALEGLYVRGYGKAYPLSGNSLEPTLQTGDEAKD